MPAFAVHKPENDTRGWLRFNDLRYLVPRHQAHLRQRRRGQGRRPRRPRLPRSERQPYRADRLERTRPAPRTSGQCLAGPSPSRISARAQAPPKPRAVAPAGGGGWPASIGSPSPAADHEGSHSARGPMAYHEPVPIRSSQYPVGARCKKQQAIQQKRRPHQPAPMTLQGGIYRRPTQRPTAPRKSPTPPPEKAQTSRATQCRHPPCGS